MARWVPMLCQATVGLTAMLLLPSEGEGGERLVIGHPIENKHSSDIGGVVCGSHLVDAAAARVRTSGEQAGVFEQLLVALALLQHRRDRPEAAVGRRGGDESLEVHGWRGVVITQIGVVTMVAHRRQPRLGLMTLVGT